MMQIEGVNIPEDEHGNLYCVCGYKPNPYNYTPSSVDKCKHYLLLEKHTCTCKKWIKYSRDIKYKESLARDAARKEAQRLHQESLDYQKKFNTKLALGWFLIVFGLILMLAIGTSYHHEYAWVGAVVIGLGFLSILGFWGVVGMIFSGLFESMSHLSELHSLSKDITVTQKFVENQNILFNKDVLGQDIDKTLKNK